MSLNKATSGITGVAKGVPNTADSVRKGDVSSTVKQPKKHIDQTTKNIADVSVPGDFPSEKKQKQAEEMPQVSFSFSSLIQWAIDRFESYVRAFISRWLPIHRREKMYESAMSRPMAATFIICQIICCGVPLLVFLAGVFLFAAVATLLWALLSLLILGPVLLVTGSMGLFLWGWGWAFYSFIRWADERFFGGMITQFLMPAADATSEDQPSSDKDQEGKKQ